MDANLNDTKNFTPPQSPSFPARLDIDYPEKLDWLVHSSVFSGSFPLASFSA